MCANPLTWWQNHEGQFLNVSFFAKQTLEIPISQIEIERVFHLAGVLTILRLTSGKFEPNYPSGKKLTW
jgi:hypothetical protein